MLQKLVSKLVDQLINENLIEVKQRESYIYTYLIWSEKIMTLGTICIIAIIFSNSFNTLIFLFFFLVLRSRTGGFHADSFMKCFIGTIMTYLVVFFCASLFTQYMELLIGLLLIAICIIEIIGTINHPNMDMSKPELDKSKKNARVITLIEGGVIFCTWKLVGNDLTIYYMSMGVIICAILLCIAKITKQEVKR